MLREARGQTRLTAGVSKDHVVLVGDLDALGVHNGTSRGTNERNTGSLAAVDIVREGEKGIRPADDTRKLGHVSFLLLNSQRRGDLVKEGSPLGVLRLRRVERRSGDEEIDGVGLIGALGALLEGERENALVVAEPPVVSLVAGETRAVDTRLLAGAKTNDGTVEGVADRVGLRVLERNRRDEEVKRRLGRKILVLGDNVLEERGLNLDVITTLLERDAVDLAGFDERGLIFGVHLRGRRQL